MLIIRLVARYEALGQNLHIARQHDEVDLVLLHQRDLLLFHRWLILLRHRQNMIGDAEFLRHPAQIRVVADDERNFDAPFARLSARKDVGQAVRFFRDENSHARHIPRKAHLPGHVEGLSDLLKRICNAIRRDGKAH